jgi:adenylate cyclase
VVADRLKTGLPLRPTLVTVVVALIVSGSAIVGWLAYLTSTRVVGDLWYELSENVASVTSERALRYFESARPYVEMTRAQAERERLDVSDPMSLLDHFRAAVEANPEFTWASYAAADGTYTAAYRDSDAGLLATWREVLPDGSSRHRTFAPEGASWTLRSDRPGDYDPRKRGWYQQALEAEGGIWVDPFLFATDNRPGFMYVAADRRGGEVHGVWAVEYEVSYLSEFLASLRVGERGSVYIVTRGGKVVGHPRGEVAVLRGGELTIADAADHPDPILASLWRELEARGGVSDRFELGDHLAMAEPFSAESGIDWIVIVAVPVDDFFGTIRSQAWSTLLIALAVALLAVVTGALFSNGISQRLRLLADEMDRIGRFELTESGADDARSFARELNAMGEAVTRMKRGLRSFGKYVPDEVVRELVQSGEEAELGAKKRELTLLFADIAGFTTIAEKMDPDELAEILGECLGAMSVAIREEGGTVDKYIGDGIMAFWGAPRLREDHAVAACRGALRMSSQLVELQRRWIERGQPSLDLRIGLNTGDALVGNFGAPDRLNYTALGDDVNLASRLEGLNRIYGTQILLGEQTAEKVNDVMVVRPVDWVAVKGRRRTLLIYELLGERGQVSERLEATVATQREALELYRARDFAQAAELFAAVASRGESEAARILGERAKRYAVSPPPADWTGTHVLTVK